MELDTHNLMTRLHNLLGGALGMMDGMTANIPAMAGSVPMIKRLQADHASIGELIAQAAPPMVAGVEASAETVAEEAAKIVEQDTADHSAGALNAAAAAANPDGMNPSAA